MAAAKKPAGKPAPKKPPADEEDLIGDGGSAPSASGKVSFADNGGPGTAASKELRSFVERIERLDEEKKGIADDIKDVFAEAKGRGFDTKVMRIAIRLRKKDVAERQEEEALLDLYLHALGMIGPASA